MAESICSSFTFENDNGFKVRIASVKLANIILCLTHFITHDHVFTLYYPEWNLLELEQSIDKFLVGCKIKFSGN